VHIIHRVKSHSESVLMIQSPFCGYYTIYCTDLNGEDISCYSNKTESLSLRKSPYDHCLINKAYLSAITVTNISQSFYLQDGAKNRLEYIWNKTTSLSPYKLCLHVGNPTLNLSHSMSGNKCGLAQAVGRIASDVVQWELFG